MGSWICPGCGVVVPDSVTWTDDESPCDCPPLNQRDITATPTPRDALARHIANQFGFGNVLSGEHADDILAALAEHGYTIGPAGTVGIPMEVALSLYRVCRHSTFHGAQEMAFALDDAIAAAAEASKETTP